MVVSVWERNWEGADMQIVIGVGTHHDPFPVEVLDRLLCGSGHSCDGSMRSSCSWCLRCWLNYGSPDG